MTIERFEVPGLAQYSYIISSEGRSVVVDPIRDTDRYLRFLEERGLTLSSIVETHIHADFASGARALAEATGAELALSGYDEGEHYQYGMPHRRLRTGDNVRVGLFVWRHSTPPDTRRNIFPLSCTTRSAAKLSR